MNESHVRQHRKKTEECAQQVLPFGDPRHRLDVKRVKREERSHQRAAPYIVRHSPQQQQEQPDIGRVEQDVDGVMHARIDAEEFHVGHMRQPGHGMPVRQTERGERPDSAVQRQSLADRLVHQYVFVVIVIDEIKVNYTRVARQCDEDRGCAKDGQPA
jgi:hypothetical protein